MKKVILLLLIVCLPVLAAAENTGAWLPCWNAREAQADAKLLTEKLDTAVVFAAVFDRKGKLLYHEGVEKLMLKTRQIFAGTEAKVYLSVVNDQQNGRGGYDSKSADLVRKLLKNDRSTAQHMDELLLLLDRSEADGLELDYENFGKDTELYGRYAELIGQLYEVLSADGLGLRVVLSWDAPRYASLPEGPEYTVMCYNLYGYHSGPGPKADLAFLREVADLWRDVPGTVRMAFATGGFLWKNGKVSEALTQQAAEALLTERAVVPVRDEASGAMTASLIHDGQRAEVWYADGETLRRWRDAMSEFDGMDIFCLGGSNTQDWLRTVLAAYAAEGEKQK